MHGQEIIHGGLKGVWLRMLVVAPPPNTLFIKANILVDNDGHAQLAEFGLLAIISDFTHPATSSSSEGGDTVRWMSPELLDPDRFDLASGRPTKKSDCYALGMVILEVLTGQPPFPQYTGLTAMEKIVDGERPERPQGAEAAWFTNDLWETLEQCWSPQPKARPTVEAVLECLEQGSTVWGENWSKATGGGVHLCGEPCKLKGKEGCQGECTKVWIRPYVSTTYS